MSISFIQTLYNPPIPLPTDEKAYKEMLADDDFILVAPSVYQLLKDQGRLKETPFFFQDLLHQEFKKSFYQNLFIKNQTDQLLNKFEEVGIEVIPLKGVYFAEKYFGNIGARATSDIDLLIKRSQLEQTIKIVRSLGFTTEEAPINDHFHLSFSKELPGSPIPLTVEIHWNIVKKNTARLDIYELWNEANPIGTYRYVKELSDYHTFYMICLHGWRHNLASMKYFIDIVQLIHKSKEQIDFNRLFVETINHQTSKRIKRTLSIVYQEFPTVASLMKIPITTYFMREKSFKNRHKGIWKYIDFFDYQVFSYDTLRHQIIKMKYLFK